jgi:hypothetical protein
MVNVMIWLNYQREQRRFMFDESETVDFSDIMNGPISIPYSRKNGMSAKKGHGRSNRIGTRLDFKGGASSPLDVDEGADDSDEWQQQAQRLLRNQDIIKRRQRSPERQVPLQTI